MFQPFLKSKSLLSKFVKTLSLSYEDLAVILENGISSFKLSWLLVDKFGFERTKVNWLMFSPVLLNYLIKRELFNNYNKGREAEIKGAEYLSHIGLELLLMNYRTKNGEIDIIAVNNNFIRFVEVKSSYTFIQPEERINSDKVNKILAVSEDFFVDLGFVLERGYDALVINHEGISYLRDYLI
jgi:putative endonuclease